MKSTLLTAFLLVCGATALLADDKKELEKLQGVWVASTAERNGKAADDLKGHQLTFTGDKFIIKGKDSTPLYEGTIQVDTSKKPATIDFMHTAGDLKGKTWKGIFVIDGDTLKTCDNAPDVTKDRPTDFVAKADSGYVAIVFKRVKS
ncbi:MAG: TIGR03067 domain-containing protein [Gemmataceae bacterium]|nr:TIGR03067 domain-containing protein [Gemmataceae bacterium]